MRDREERSKKEAEGSRTAVRPRDDLVGEEIVGPDIRGQEGRPEKRRKLALTSSDEYESNGNGQIGKGKGKGQEGDRAGRWKGKGKENAVDARQGEAGGLPKRFVAKPEPVINQEEPQRRSLDPVTLTRGRSEPEVRPPPQVSASSITQYDIVRPLLMLFLPLRLGPLPLLTPNPCIAQELMKSCLNGLPNLFLESSPTHEETFSHNRWSTRPSAVSAEMRRKLLPTRHSRIGGTCLL